MLIAALILAAQPLVIGETFAIRSAVLNETRRINIYLPAAYAADVRLPVLYMPDGGVQEDFLHVAGLVQVMSGNGTMRPFILVGIENTERRRDLTGPTENARDKTIAPHVGGSAQFRTFIRDELIPEIEKRYRTTNERAIVGESLAGLFVIETLVVEPSLFNTYIAFDPSVWWSDGKLIDEAKKRFSENPLKDRTVYIATSRDGVGPAENNLITLLRETKSIRFHHEAMPEEKHSTIYHPAALRAFRTVLAP